MCEFSAFFSQIDIAPGSIDPSKVRNASVILRLLVRAESLFFCLILALFRFIVSVPPFTANGRPSEPIQSNDYRLTVKPVSS